MKLMHLFSIIIIFSSSYMASMNEAEKAKIDNIKQGLKEHDQEFKKMITLTSASDPTQQQFKIPIEYALQSELFYLNISNMIEKFQTNKNNELYSASEGLIDNNKIQQLIKEKTAQGEFVTNEPIPLNVPPKTIPILIEILKESHNVPVERGA